jgi:hypothetical protein
MNYMYYIIKNLYLCSEINAKKNYKKTTII